MIKITLEFLGLITDSLSFVNNKEIQNAESSKH